MPIDPDDLPLKKKHTEIILGQDLSAMSEFELGARIVDPQDFNRVFQDTPLEVVLVNARSQEAPTKAQAIAPPFKPSCVERATINAVSGPGVTFNSQPARMNSRRS